MRWPFNLFARSGSESAPAVPPAAVPRASGHDWAGLPPIQRSVGDAPLTASAQSFAASLPGTVGVPRALQPLGHAHSPDAPSGLVRGLTSSYAGSERLVYVQRRPAGMPQLTWPEWGVEASPPAPGAPAPSQVEPAAGEAVVDAPAVEVPAVEPAARAPRAVPAVAPAPRLPALTVSRLPEAARPFAPVVGSRPGLAGLPTSAAASSPVAAWAAEPAASSRRLNVGQSRRMGLGMPFVPPVLPAVQRSSDEDELPASSGGPSAADVAGADDDGPPVQRQVEGSGPPASLVSHAPFSSAPAVPPDPSTELSRPIFRVQRRTPGAPQRTVQRADASPVVRMPGSPAAMPVVPEIGRAPAGSEPPASADPLPDVPVQRSASGLPAEAAPPEPVVPLPADLPAPGPASLTVVPVQRLEVASGESDSAGLIVPDDQAQRLGSAVGATSLPVMPAQPIVTRPEPTAPSAAPLPVVPVQRAGVEPEHEPESMVEPDAAVEPPDEEPPADAEPAPVVPAQRLDAGSAPVAGPSSAAELPAAGLAAGALPVVPVERSQGPGGAATASGTVPQTAGVAGPVVVSRRLAGTPVPPAGGAATPILPLVGTRSLPVSVSAPAGSPASAAAFATGGPAIVGGAAPAPGFLAAVTTPLQRFAETSDVPEAAWPATNGAAALAPLARAVRPVAQATPAAQGLAGPAPALPYVPVASARPSAEPVVQPTMEAPQFVSIEVPVQRAEEAPAASGAAPGAAADGAAGAAGHHSEKELDDLARQLYERLRSRLRLELLVDRERAGLITDLRG